MTAKHKCFFLLASIIHFSGMYIDDRVGSLSLLAILVEETEWALFKPLGLADNRAVLWLFLPCYGCSCVGHKPFVMFCMLDCSLAKFLT